MKKFAKKFIISIVIFLIMCHNLVIAASQQTPKKVDWTFAPNSFFTTGLGTGIKSIGQKISSIIGGNSSTLGKIFGLLSIVFTFSRLVCLAAVLIMGIRYMMSSAESRADLKQRMLPLFIGLVVVFGASSIMSIAINYLNRVF